MLGSFFEQDHLLNLFILRVYAKRWPKCARISKQKLRTIHWGKKYWGTRLVSEKNGSFVYAELNKTVEVATRSYSTTCKFLRYIYSALKAKNYQNIRSRCLVHQFSFPDFLTFHFIWLWHLIAIMKRRRRTNAGSLSIFILSQLQSWIILRVRSKFLFRNFHTKRVIIEIAIMKIFNNCISGRLNNVYFPLNQSSSLY